MDPEAPTETAANFSVVVPIGVSVHAAINEKPLNVSVSFDPASETLPVTLPDLPPQAVVLVNSRGTCCEPVKAGVELAIKSVLRARFDMLPEEVLSYIAMSLPPAQLALFAQLNRRCRTIGGRADYWRDHIDRDFGVNSLSSLVHTSCNSGVGGDDGRLVVSVLRELRAMIHHEEFGGDTDITPRDYFAANHAVALHPAIPGEAARLQREYVGKLRAHATMKRERDAARLAHAQLRMANTCGNYLRVALDVSNYLISYGCPCVLVLLFVVLAGLKMDGQLTGVSPAGVFAPLLALVLWIVGALCGGLLMDVFVSDQDDDETSIWWQQHTANERSFPGLVRQYISEEIRDGPYSNMRLTYAALMCGSAGLVPLVLALRFSESGLMAAAPWSLVLVPLWVLMAGWLCFPCCTTTHMRRRKPCRVWLAATLVLGLPFVAALVLLLVKVDLSVTSISAVHVAVPLFVIHGLVCCTCIGGCALNFYRWIRRRSTLDKEEFLLITLAMIVVLLIFTSTLILVLHFEFPGDSRFGAAAGLVPVELLLGGLVVGGVVLAVAQLRRARRNEFKGLYGPALVACLRCCCRHRLRLRHRHWLLTSSKPFRRPALVEADSKHTSAALV